MTDEPLAGRRVLVAEDEFMIADDMAQALERLGAEVLGPVPTLPRVLSLIETEGWIDAAVLDINLRGEMVWPAADRLVSRQVPIIFATGYDPVVIPARFAGIIRCEKPVDAMKVVAALRRAAA